LDGSPKRENKCQVNWWEFSKTIFSEICAPVEESQEIIKEIE
jgi:hypothetical protein